VCTASINEK
jgi:hypothetical protein